MIVVYGTRFYGTVEQCGEARIATRFFHLYYMPLIPLGTTLITQESSDGSYRGIPLGIELRSMLTAYARAWLPLAAFGFGIAAMAAWDEAAITGYGGPISTTLIALLAAAVSILAWVRVGRLDLDARAQRLLYRQFTGVAVDPARLGDVRKEVRERLHATVSERAPVLAANGYRMGPGPSAEWIDVALDPSVREAEFLGASLTLARLEWSVARGPAREEWAKKHDRLWARLKEIEPSITTTATRL